MKRKLYLVCLAIVLCMQGCSRDRLTRSFRQSKGSPSTTETSKVEIGKTEAVTKYTAPVDDTENNSSNDFKIIWPQNPSTEEKVKDDNNQEVKKKNVIRPCRPENIESARVANFVIVKVGDTRASDDSRDNNGPFRELANALQDSLFFYDCDRKIHDTPDFAATTLPTFFGIKKGSTGHKFKGLHPGSDGFKYEGTNMIVLRAMIDNLVAGVETPETVVPPVEKKAPAKQKATAKVRLCTWQDFGQDRPVYMRLTSSLVQEFDLLAEDPRFQGKAIFCEATATILSSHCNFFFATHGSRSFAGQHFAKIVGYAVKSLSKTSDELQLHRWAISGLSGETAAEEPGPKMQLYYVNGEPYYKPYVESTTPSPAPRPR